MLDWYLYFFKYHLGIYNEDVNFFETSRAGVFDGSFVFSILWIFVHGEPAVSYR